MHASERVFVSARASRSMHLCVWLGWPRRLSACAREGALLPAGVTDRGPRSTRAECPRAFREQLVPKGGQATPSPTRAGVAVALERLIHPHLVISVRAAVPLPGARVCQVSVSLEKLPLRGG